MRHPNGCEHFPDLDSSGCSFCAAAATREAYEAGALVGECLDCGRPHQAKNTQVRDAIRAGDISSEEEVRVVSDTGGAKGQKLARYELIPHEPLLELAKLYGQGALKYDERNWERGYAFSLSFAALMRHAWQFWAGEDHDEETQRHHLACVAFHAFAMMAFQARGIGEDDRP